MEQASGMAWMTGFSDGPPVIPRGPCDPLAGMHAAFALLGALHERDTSGHGHLVESTMIESALNVAGGLVLEESAYGRTVKRDGNRSPHCSPQGIFRCRDVDGQERWVALSVASDGQWKALCAV